MVGCSGDLVTDSTKKLGCKVKIRSIHEDEFSSICIGLLIIWYKPNCHAILSIEIPIELLHHGLVCLWNHRELQVRPKLTENNAKWTWD